MSWQMLAGDVVKHRELALALTCVGMAGWELVEFSILEEPVVTVVRSAWVGDVERIRL